MKLTTDLRLEPSFTATSPYAFVVSAGTISPFYLKELICDHANGIQLAENSVQWRVILNMVLNIRASQKVGNFFTT
jgi:hypothetical protein